MRHERRLLTVLEVYRKAGVARPSKLWGGVQKFVSRGSVFKIKQISNSPYIFFFIFKYSSIKGTPLFSEVSEERLIRKL
jgi:hypothetical protein